MERFYRKKTFSFSSYLRFCKAHRGFTLIELLVIMSIMTVIFGIGVAAFGSYGKYQTVNQAASDLKSALEKAKFSALSKVKPSSCTSAMQLTSYRLVVSGNTYSVQAVCGTPNTYVTVSQATFPSNVAITAGSCLISPINFYVITNAVGCAGASFPLIYTVSGYGISKNVLIDVGGNIRVQ